jgi:hypothetical protein
VIIALTSLVFSFSINLFVATDQSDWFEKSSLGNTLLTPITVWVHVGLLTFFSVATFYYVFEIREEAKAMYKEHQMKLCKNKDYEWLRARTLHVRGVHPKDRGGFRLKGELNRIIKPSGGQVLSVSVIPDYQTLLLLEEEKKDLKDLDYLYSANDKVPSCVKCFYNKN